MKTVNRIRVLVESQKSMFDDGYDHMSRIEAVLDDAWNVLRTNDQKRIGEVRDALVELGIMPADLHAPLTAREVKQRDKLIEKIKKMFPDADGEGDGRTIVHMLNLQWEGYTVLSNLWIYKRAKSKKKKKGEAVMLPGEMRNASVMTLSELPKVMPGIDKLDWNAGVIDEDRAAVRTVWSGVVTPTMHEIMIIRQSRPPEFEPVEIKEMKKIFRLRSMRNVDDIEQGMEPPE